MIRNWEERKSDIALYETHQELESQRLELQQANQWADQAQRVKNSLWRIGMRNRFFEKIAQKLAKKLKNCEENRSSWTSKNWWLVYASKEGSCCYESTLDSNSAITNRVNSLSDAREFFTILKQRAALERPTFFCQPLTIPSPRTMPCRDSNVFERLPAREGPPSAHLLADLDLTLQEIRWYRKVKWDGNRQNSSMPVPRNRGGGILDHTGETYSHGGTMGYKRFPISDMHLGKFPDSGISKLESQLRDWSVF